MTSRKLVMAALLGSCRAGALTPLLLSASAASPAETLTGGRSVAVDASGGQDAASGPSLATYATVPLHFEANQGQTDSRVKFLARGGGYTLFLTADEAVLVAAERAAHTQSAHRGEPNFEVPGERRGTVLRMQFVGARSQPRIVGSNKLRGKSHYLLGNDPKQWRTEVPMYGRVAIGFASAYAPCSRT